MPSKRLRREILYGELIGQQSKGQNTRFKDHIKAHLKECTGSYTFLELEVTLQEWPQLKLHRPQTPQSTPCAVLLSTEAAP